MEKRNGVVGRLGFSGYFSQPCSKGRAAININRCKRWFFMAAKKRNFSINAVFGEKLLHLPTNNLTMRKRNRFIIWMLTLFLLFSSCASQQSRAMRKAERRMEKMEKQSKKQLEQAKSAHYKHQAKKTKRMIKKDKRRAERMRRRQRSNPFFSS